MKKIISAGLVVLALVVYLILKPKPASERADPAFYHTPAGVNAVMQEQRALLTEAFARKDLSFIHGQMYYLQGLADALALKVQGEELQRLRPQLVQIKTVAEEIDNFAGRGNVQATEAGLRKLEQALDQLNAQFKK